MRKISIYDELASELITCPDFSNYYGRLLKSKRVDDERLNSNEIIFLLQTASIYSHCCDEKFKQISYIIASNIFEQYYDQYNNLTPIIQYIFISTGLLPSVKKTINDGYQDYFSIYQESNIPYNPFHFKEVIKKQVDNKIVLYNLIETVYFTDFQKETFDLLSSQKNISVSSPTSSGKSFLLAIFIAKKVLEQNIINIVYIVPTRALISQVIADINIELKRLNLDKITLISNISKTLNPNSSKIFILTQERYHSLLFDSGFNENIDLLVIDEAQKISEDSRGILLEIVIEESLSRFSPMQIVFLSPNIQNPSEYQIVFDLESLFIKKTAFSPVSQNLYFLNINKSGYELLHSIAEFEKPIIILDEKFKAASSIIKEINKSALFWAIKKFGDCCNIIYCNSPKKCVEDALIFSENLTSINNSDLNELIELLKLSIHSNYYLIKCLRKGVAFHHGRMPTPIRNFIEDLFKKKIINYLFCTSTLLEGINLPAKNIFIYKPTKGKKNFDKSNFWNLAGRAGRLLKDFSGNIFCINIHEWKGYTPNINDKEYSVESYYTTTINSNSKKLFDAIDNIDENIIIKNESFEYSLTRLMVDSLKNKGNDKKIQISKNESQFDVDLVSPLLNTIQENTKKITIPLNILQKNPSILPLKQQTLLWLFEELPNTVIIPLHPSNEGFYPNLERIIQFN